MGVREPHVVLHRDDVNETKVGLSESVQQTDVEQDFKEEQLRRNLNVLTITIFTAIATSSWVFVLSGSTGGFDAGGTGGFIVVYIGTAVVYTSIVVSMAEMASMVPTAGGPYHWASALAPRWQRPLSYAAGWLLTLSWLCGVTSGMFLTAEEIRMVAFIGKDSADAQPYQTYLIVIGLTMMGCFINTVCAKYFALFELGGGALLALGFVVYLIVYAVMSPMVSAETVFGAFVNGDEWSNTGFGILTAQTAAIWLLIGSDGAAHMAEETRNASRNVPVGIMWSYAFEAFTGLGMLILFCFCFNEETLNSATGFPFMAVNLSATGSVAGAKALSSIVILLTFISATNFMASASRQTWAFARDHGFPFGKWIGKVSSTFRVPVNAILVVCGFVILLSLISLGSTVAFQAIISLQLVALFATYEVSICTLIWRRLSGLPLPHAKWSLGRYGLSINIFAAVYGLFAIAFIVLPPVPGVDPQTVNWGPFIFILVMIVAGLCFVIGAKAYHGPTITGA